MTIERPAADTAAAVDRGNRSAAHPASCERCRHAMTWGKIEHGDLRINGLCLRGHKKWPDGCGHYAERAK